MKTFWKSITLLLILCTTNLSAQDELGSQTIKETSLNAESCGAVYVSIEHELHAIDIGADQYEFMVSNERLGLSELISSPSPFFKLSMLSQAVEQNMDYHIRVRGVFNGVAGPWSRSCSVLTEIVEQVPISGSELVDENGDLAKAFDRFGNTFELEELRIPKNSLLAGIFELHFYEEDNGLFYGFNDPAPSVNPSNCPGDCDDLGEERRFVIKQVFEDLSELLVPGGVPAGMPEPYPGVATPQYVQIAVRANETPAGPMSPSALGVASQYFLEIGDGLAHGEVWKTINTGWDSYANLTSELFGPVPTYHGYMSINFSGVIDWYQDLTATSAQAASEYDLYTVALHEAIHALGFASLMDGAGEGLGGFYSPFDTHLQYSGSNMVASSSTPEYCYNSELDVPVAAVSPGCGNVFWNGNGSENDLHIIYSPASFEFGSSLSHFNCPGPDTEYIMNSSLVPGSYTRVPHLSEVQTLCDLGYNIQNTYGTGEYAVSTTTYTGACTSLMNAEVAGVNDFFSYNPTASGDPYITSFETPIIIDDALSNDHNADEVRCAEYFGGAGTVTMLSATSFEVTPPDGIVTDIIVKYRPYNSTTGQYGNNTYVFIEMEPYEYPPCEPEVCNYVCYGDFEAFIGAGFDGNLVGYPFNDCAFALPFPNTPDLYDAATGIFQNVMSCGNDPMVWPAPEPLNGGDKYVGMAANIGKESVVLELSQPMLPGESFKISLLGHRIIGDGTCPPSGHLVRVVLSDERPCPIPIVTDPEGTTNCGDWTVVADVVATFDVSTPSWVTYSVSGVELPPGMTEANYVSIIAQEGMDSYMYVDNVEIIKEGDDILEITGIAYNPSPCPGDTVTITYDICMGEGTTNENEITLDIDLPAGVGLYLGDFAPMGTFTIPPGDITEPCTYQLVQQVIIAPSAIPGVPLDIGLSMEGGGCVPSGSSLPDITIVPGDDFLTITKSTTTSGPFALGETVVFEIEVCNSSLMSAATDIVVEDILPASLSYVGSFDFTAVGPTLTSIPFDLAVGECKTLVYQATIASIECNNIENCASIIAGTGACNFPKTHCADIAVDGPGPVADLGPDQTICIGESITLDACLGGLPGQYSYEWEDPIGDLGDPEVCTVTVSPTENTTYCVRITDNFTGCISGEACITVIVLDIPVDILTLPASICETADPINLVVEPADGTFSGIGVTDLGGGAGLFDPSVPGLGFTDIVYTVTADGCTFYDTISMEVIPAPAVSGASFEGCVDEAIEIYPMIPDGEFLTYEWADGSTGPTNIIVPGLAGLFATTVTVYGTNGCSRTVTITVNVHDLPDLSLGDDQMVCPGESAILTATSTDGGTISWYDPSGDYIGDGETIEVTPPAIPFSSNIYTATITDAQGCVNSETVVVSVSFEPDVSDVDGSSYCVDEVIILPNPYAGAYWSGPYVTLGVDGVTNYFSPTAAGTYTLTLCNADGCCSEAIVTVYDVPFTIVSQVNACEGSCTGAIELESSGGPYNWSTEVDGDVVTQFGTTATFDDLCIGSYIITISRAVYPFCSTTIEVDILEEASEFPKTTSNAYLRDHASDISNDDEGNVFMTGGFNRGTSFDGLSLDYTDISYLVMYVAAYDVCGDLSWVATAHDQQIRSSRMAVDEEYGLVYVVGTFNGNAVFTPGINEDGMITCGGGLSSYTTSSTQGAFVAVYTTEGCLLHVHEMPSSSPGMVLEGEGIATSTFESAFLGLDHRVYFSTRQYSSGGPAGNQLKVFAKTPNFVAPYTFSFTDEWEATINSSEMAWIRDMETYQGYLSFVGTFRTDLNYAGGTFLNGFPGKNDAFIYNWVDMGGGPFNAFNEDLYTLDSPLQNGEAHTVTMSDNTIVLGGIYKEGISSAFGGDNLMPPFTGSKGAFVTKLQFTGTMDWINRISSNSTASVQSLDTDGTELYIGGNFFGGDYFYNTTLEGSYVNKRHSFVSRWNLASGLDSWTNVSTGVGDGYSYNTGLTFFNDYTYTCGHYTELMDQSNNLGGTLTSSPFGYQNACLWRFRDLDGAAKMQVQTSSGITTESVSNFSIYPNPNNGAFTLSYTLTEDVGSHTLELYNSIGERCYMVELGTSKGNGTKELKLDLPTGAYFVRHLIDGEQLASQKLIITNS